MCTRSSTRIRVVFTRYTSAIIIIILIMKSTMCGTTCTRFCKKNFIFFSRIESPTRTTSGADVYLCISFAEQNTKVSYHNRPHQVRTTVISLSVNYCRALNSQNVYRLQCGVIHSPRLCVCHNTGAIHKSAYLVPLG